jgi:hypothetical protein
MASLSSAARRLGVAAIAASVVLLGGACASGNATPAAAGTGDVTAAGSPKHDRTTITADDMKSLDVANLYDVIQRLHPEWLVQRNNPSMSGGGGRRGSGTSSDQSIQVYQDMQHAGNTDMLKQIPINAASALKYYTPSEAEAKFGTGNANAVIQILTTKK